MEPTGEIMLHALIFNEHSTISRMIDGEIKRKIATARTDQIAESDLFIKREPVTHQISLDMVFAVRLRHTSTRKRALRRELFAVLDALVTTIAFTTILHIAVCPVTLQHDEMPKSPTSQVYPIRLTRGFPLQASA